MRSNGGPGWSETNDGKILFRPNRWSETYKISKSDHVRIQKLKQRELWAGLTSVIPVAALAVLWLRGDLSPVWPVVALCLYIAGNSLLSLARSRATKEITLRATRSPVELEFAPLPTARDLGDRLLKGYMASFKRKLHVLGYSSLIFGIVGAVLVLAGIERFGRFPVPGIGLSAALLALGATILFIEWRRDQR